MVLDVLGIHFSYNSHPILEDISFKVRRGELICILGVNGAGKSTLLKCLNRILTPVKGSVLINGNNLFSINREELGKKFAFIPQNPPSSSLTVYETILLGRKPYFNWRVKKQDHEIVGKIIKDLSLESLVLKPLSQLSGGERQKVVIARALAQKPEVLLFDEPTSNLDIKNQLEIMSTIKGVVNNNDVAAIIAIHDINLAFKFGDRFLFLKDHKVFSILDSKYKVTPDIIKEVYGIEVEIKHINQNPIVVPI